MKTINLLPLVGSFAENKDIAREIRINKIIPAIENKEKVVLNFAGINSTTQSFIHALISDLIRKYDSEIFDVVLFKNCTETVQKIITIVADYMRERD